MCTPYVFCLQATQVLFQLCVPNLHMAGAFQFLVGEPLQACLLFFCFEALILLKFYQICFCCLGILLPSNQAVCFLCLVAMHGSPSGNVV